MSIENFILENEVTVRLICFAGIFIIMAIWEIYRPRRKLQHPKLQRWAGNIGITFINYGAIAFFVPCCCRGGSCLYAGVKRRVTATVESSLAHFSH